MPGPLISEGWSPQRLAWARVAHTQQRGGVFASIARCATIRRVESDRSRLRRRNSSRPTTASSRAECRPPIENPSGSTGCYRSDVFARLAATESIIELAQETHRFQFRYSNLCPIRAVSPPMRNSCKTSWPRLASWLYPIQRCRTTVTNDSICPFSRAYLAQTKDGSFARHRRRFRRQKASPETR